MKLKVSQLAEKTVFTIPGIVYSMRIQSVYEYSTEKMSAYPHCTVIGTGKNCYRVAPLIGGEYQTELNVYVGKDTETDLEFEA